MTEEKSEKEKEIIQSVEDVLGIVQGEAMQLQKELELEIQKENQNGGAGQNNRE